MWKKKNEEEGAYSRHLERRISALETEKEILQAEINRLKRLETDNRRSMFLGFKAYGVSIPESLVDVAPAIFEELVKRVNQVSSELTITDSEFWNSLTTHQQQDVLRLMKDVMLAQDADYLRLHDRLSSFVLSYLKKNK
ncbi:MAG: hypothetical protein ACFFDV_09270 [Candidatus Thorarchaeota archaeon]